MRQRMPVEISDEEILLLGLCRFSFSEELKRNITTLVSGVKDWKYFTGLASEHGVSALVWSNLQKLGLQELLTDEYKSALYSSHLLSISRNAFHLAGTEELLSHLNKEGIKVILLKGLALELTVYGNAGLRQMTDVDLLIDRRDYLKARNILMDNGYDSMPVKSGFHKPIVEWTGKHLPSLMKNGLSVDIHLELFPGRKNNLTARVIETAGEIKLEREKVYVPAPQLFFLYLARHLYGHELNNESQLRLYTDLVVMVEKYREEILNYELISNAREAGISKILAWKLEPLRDLWGLEFPDWLNEFTSRWFNPDSINRFIFFLKSPKGNKPVNPGKVYRDMIREIPGLHRKILFILGDIFPSVTFMKGRYSVKNTFKVLLYYPLRLGKLLRLVSK
ncbi:MAG: nucleotidyltransferase domain-containing protein [Bacteroidales bacterium]